MENQNESLEVKHKNPISKVGFAMMHHVITLDLRISDGAYRLYALILKYAHDKGKAWPSCITLADLLGKSVDTVYRRLDQLEEYEYLQRELRPGKQSILWVLDLTTNDSLLNIALKLAQPPPVGVEKRTPCKNATTPLANLPHEEESIEEQSVSIIKSENSDIEDDFVEELEYTDDPFDEDKPSRKEPVWKTKYGKDDQGQHDLLFTALKACGKRNQKFDTNQDSKNWRQIALKIYSLKLNQEAGRTNVYPVEWIKNLIAWAIKKNTIQAGSIKFSSLLTAIMNIERCDEFIGKWYKKKGKSSKAPVIEIDDATGMVKHG